MKYFFLPVFFLFSLNLYAQTTILLAFKDSGKNNDSDLALKKGLGDLEIDLQKNLADEKLAIINHILKNTRENFIHKMRGENGNTVYYNTNGNEVVYDKDGKVVKNEWNKGSFNYGNYDKPIQKFLLDIWPWLIWGNSKKDPTSFAERLSYYCKDLNDGIQAYIFLDNKEKIEEINYSDLRQDEKLVYYLFDYLIFNKSYTVELSNDNIPTLRDSADFYWRYFNQIMELIGYKKE